MTPRRLLATLVLALATTPALAAWDVAQLMTELARNRGGQALFTEKKYIALLDKPVISSGEMRYTAPDYLEKRTLLQRTKLVRQCTKPPPAHHVGAIADGFLSGAAHWPGFCALCQKAQSERHPWH